MAGRCLQAVFLDRDGTIGGSGLYAHPRDFVPYPFTADAMSLLKRNGLMVFAFTNQTHIADGDAPIEEFMRQFESLGFDHAYVCPHRDGDECSCRKPKPGLLLQAAHDFGLDLACTAVVGDMGATDMLAANAVGALKVLVKTGLGLGSLGEYRSTWAGVEPDYVAENVLDAAEWLVRTHCVATPGVRSGAPDRNGSRRQ